LETLVALVTVKDKFQVTIPAKLRDQADISVGDLLEATIEQGAIVLRPKTVVDRAAVAADVERVLAAAKRAPEDRDRNEAEIVEDAISEVKATRRAPPRSA
jgi:looped-hinge helix DNA binding domain, AbrB family